jgi:predicted RNA-binding Zn ribbon-like protein
MTGQTIGSVSDFDAAWREPSLPQPGARDPAPAHVACVQGFINSHYDLEFDHGADLFATPVSLAGWLARRKLLPSPADPLTGVDVQRAVAVREGLRALALANGEPAAKDVTRRLAALNEAARGTTLEVRLGESGPSLLASGRPGLDRALGAVLAITVRAMIDGSWTRLKVCPGVDCGWAFYDHSRNQSGRWCSMAVCGGRAKARTHYRRRRGGD